MDILPDWTDQVGSEAIYTVLDKEFPLPKLRETLSAMLRSGQVSTRQRGQFELYRSPLLTVVADTNASYGYCYIAAWATEEGQ